jgi:hypothetical protein
VGAGGRWSGSRQTGTTLALTADRVRPST